MSRKSKPVAILYPTRYHVTLMCEDLISGHCLELNIVFDTLSCVRKFLFPRSNLLARVFQADPRLRYPKIDTYVLDSFSGCCVTIAPPIKAPSNYPLRTGRCRLGSFMRRPRTYREKANALYEIEGEYAFTGAQARAKRNSTNLPCAWDDMLIEKPRTWKRFRRTQYKLRD